MSTPVTSGGALVTCNARPHTPHRPQSHVTRHTRVACATPWTPPSASCLAAQGKGSLSPSVCLLGGPTLLSSLAPEHSKSLLLLRPLAPPASTGRPTRAAAPTAAAGTAPTPTVTSAMTSAAGPQATAGSGGGKAGHTTRGVVITGFTQEEGSGQTQGVGVTGAAKGNPGHTAQGVVITGATKGLGLAMVVTGAAKEAPGHTRGVVITGATKGLGLAMAAEFAAAGDRVLICGRDPARLRAALDSLRQLRGRGAEGGGGGDHGARDCAQRQAQGGAHVGEEEGEGEGGVFGIVCDVGRAEDVAALATLAREKLGTVHFWINNAGQVTSKSLLSDVPTEEIVSAIAANVTGSILCSREAIRLMLEQPAPGLGPSAPFRIFNMGFSRWGASFTRSTATHKATKLALTQLTASLAEELQQAGVGSIAVHNLSPGMVLTDLLLKDSTPASRRFFNALAEEPETVARDLVARMRAMDSSTPSGASLDYLTPFSAVGRVLSRLPQIINGGRFFDKEGRRVEKEGEDYAENGVRVQLRTLNK